jgi:hypothetical protein
MTIYFLQPYEEHASLKSQIPHLTINHLATILTIFCSLTDKALCINVQGGIVHRSA